VFTQLLSGNIDRYIWHNTSATYHGRWGYMYTGYRPWSYLIGQVTQ